MKSSVVQIALESKKYKGCWTTEGDGHGGFFLLQKVCYATPKSTPLSTPVLAEGIGRDGYFSNWASIPLHGNGRLVPTTPDVEVF